MQIEERSQYYYGADRGRSDANSSPAHYRILDGVKLYIFYSSYMMLTG